MASLLFMLVLGSQGIGTLLPDSAFSAPFEIILNRGPGGKFQSGGCMELVFSIDASGIAHDVRVLRSSGQYSIDRAVLKKLDNYHFSMEGISRFEEWKVFFSWDGGGKRAILSNK